VSAEIIAFPRPRRQSREERRAELKAEIVGILTGAAKTPRDKKRARKFALHLIADIEAMGLAHRQRRGD
jgi:hypothetical protein